MKLFKKVTTILVSAFIFPGLIGNAKESKHETEITPAQAKEPLLNHKKEVEIRVSSANYPYFDYSDFKGYELDGEDAHKIDDPIEPFNRGIFSFNKGVDTLVLNPIAHVYRAVVPVWGRDRVDNALANFKEPINFGNSVLQGDPEKAGRAVGRFLVNTIFGLGGLIDVATEAGIPAVSEDFGKTLAHYGVDTGPYLVVPIIGPSSLRDLPSLGVDAAMDPYSWVLHPDASYIRTGVKLVNTKESLLDPADKIERIALDEYNEYRSIYAQKRKLKNISGN